MLSDEEARGMGTWVIAANAWSMAAQSMVGTATALATQSRELADQLQGGALGSPGAGPDPDGGAPSLDAELRTLADSVEADTQDLRDRYLATAAEIEQYTDVLG